MDGESALDVVEHAEVLARLVNRDDVLEAGRVGRVGADLAVDLDQSLRNNEGDLVRVQGVLELVAEEDLCACMCRKSAVMYCLTFALNGTHGHGQGLAELVGTRRRAGRVRAAELVQHPAGWRRQTLNCVHVGARWAENERLCLGVSSTCVSGSRTRALRAPEGKPSQTTDGAS